MLGVTEQLVSILSVQQCASCCITASALYNVAVPTQADQDDRVVNYAGK